MAAEPQNLLKGTRRAFLGIAGVSLMSARAADKKVRLAVVGGLFGATHHWHEHPNCEVVAVSDLLEERRQRLVNQYGCRNVFRSMEEMFDKAADTFDAVALYTDTSSHARHDIFCLNAGKHVCCAVPLADTLEDCIKVKETMEKTRLKYMLFDSSYYRQPCICARELYQAGAFGRLAYSEVEYYHPGIGGRVDTATRWMGLKNWRYGLPPMLYSHHALGLAVGVTGERIAKVSCLGQRIGEDFPTEHENPYHNPFNNEMALGITNKGNICRFGGFWRVAAAGERGNWLGEKMTCYMLGSGGQPQTMVKYGQASWPDVGEGAKFDPWNVPEYWRTDRLPERMRHDSGHGGSSCFLSNEFINAILEDRSPATDIYYALAVNVPGIIAHQSALRGGVQLEVPKFDPTP